MFYYCIIELYSSAQGCLGFGDIGSVGMFEVGG